jgi:hypothetical protein
LRRNLRFSQLHGVTLHIIIIVDNWTHIRRYWEAVFADILPSALEVLRFTIVWIEKLPETSLVVVLRVVITRITTPRTSEARVPFLLKTPE